MIKKVRAARAAAAVFGTAAAVFIAGPAQAWQGGTEAKTPHYLDHADPGASVSTLAPGSIKSPGSRPLTRQTAPSRPRSLHELVPALARTETVSREQDCLANAVYFEARGESLEGQLAVADVVLNRVEAPEYPDTICEVVVQPWQFSFVRDRVIPNADRRSEAWAKAVAVSRIAEAGALSMVPKNVLWYHADYVAPVWGKRLARQDKIGVHIFYS